MYCCRLVTVSDFVWRRVWGVGRDLERWTTSCSPFTEPSEQTVLFLFFPLGLRDRDRSCRCSVITHRRIHFLTFANFENASLPNNVQRDSRENKRRQGSLVHHAAIPNVMQRERENTLRNTQSFRITFPQRILTHSDVSRYTFSGSERTLNESIQNVHFEGAHVVPRILLFSFTTWLCVHRVEWTIRVCFPVLGPLSG